MTKEALIRILSANLVADGNRVRVRADKYHVATVNDGMNDSEAYAQLFAASPKLLKAAINVLLNPRVMETMLTPQDAALLREAVQEAGGTP